MLGGRVASFQCHAFMVPIILEIPTDFMVESVFDDLLVSAGNCKSVSTGKAAIQRQRRRQWMALAGAKVNVQFGTGAAVSASVQSFRRPMLAACPGRAALHLYSVCCRGWCHERVRH